MRIIWYIALALMPWQMAAAQATLDTIASEFPNRDGELAVAVITEDIALERSVGQVLLHVGDGFNPYALRSLADRFADAGFPVSIYLGGPDGLVQAYMYGNRYPPEPYSSANTHEMAYIVIRIGRENGLID